MAVTDGSKIAPIDACVFDAYGTLFDVHSAAAHCQDALGEVAAPLSALWRQKQVEYTWLRSLMGRHADFWQVTGDSLDYALARYRPAAPDPALRARLMQSYRSLDAYPEVPEVLAILRDRGFATAILSNGSPEMLAAAVGSAGIAALLHQVLSVEDVGVYKPHPSVYRLAVDRLGVPTERICFVSSNGWDAAGAAAFGFRVVWVNRFGQAPERLPVAPAATLTDLLELPHILDAEAAP